MSNRRYPFFVFGLVLLLGACATSVPVQVQKPAEINMRGAKTVAVLPFGYPTEGQNLTLEPYQLALARFYGLPLPTQNPLERQMAAYLTSQVNSLIANSRVYTLTQSETLRNAGAPSSPLAVDAVLTGRIQQMDVRATSGTEDRKDADGNVTTVPWSQLDFVLVFDYQALDTATQTVLGSKVKRDNETLRWFPTQGGREPDAAEVWRRLIDSQVGSMSRELIPFTVTEYRTLAEDTTDNPVMKQAKTLVENGFYERARGLYDEVYASTRNFAAGFNAALMLELEGNIWAAADAMERLSDNTANPQALREWQRMNQTIEEEAQARAQTVRP